MKRFLEIIGVFLAIICVGMGCGKDELNMAWNPEDTTADTLTIHVGETVEATTGETLTFQKLVEDSRCPANAVCIWQGLVTVDMLATKGAQQQTFSLSTDPNEPGRQSVAVLGYKVTLVNVLPYPGTTESVLPGDYVVEVVVAKN